MKRKNNDPMITLWDASSNTLSHLSDIEEGEPFDPRPTVAEEIEMLQQIEANLESSFDKKITHEEWNAVDSALDSEIHHIKATARRIFAQLPSHLDS